MKVFVCIVCLCLIGVAYSQILRPGNTPEDSGAPIYEEITVESVLTVRSKSGSRTGKSSSDLSKQARNASETIDGARVSRRTRSAELREEEPAEKAASILPLPPASSATSAHRNRRAVHPKIVLGKP